MRNYQQSVGFELREVDIARGGDLIVTGINLKVLPGDIIQLFGRNGSGKTSLLQVIAGLTPKSGGDILWKVNEKSITPKRPAQLISFIGHNVPLKLALSGGENLQYWAELYNADYGEIYSLLEHVNLSHVETKPAGRYSAGQKRRLDLARCLLAKRPLWFLDEPTSSLDESSRALWTQEIKAHQRKGGCAIIGTHDRLDVSSRDIHLG